MEVKSDIMKVKEESLVDKEYLLEKFPGKGGWTYALIPEILQDKILVFWLGNRKWQY